MRRLLSFVCLVVCLSHFAFCQGVTSLPSCDKLKKVISNVNSNFDSFIDHNVLPEVSGPMDFDPTITKIFQSTYNPTMDPSGWKCTVIQRYTPQGAVRLSQFLCRQENHYVYPDRSALDASLSSCLGLGNPQTNENHTLFPVQPSYSVGSGFGLQEINFVVEHETREGQEAKAAEDKASDEIGAAQAAQIKADLAASQSFSSMEGIWVCKMDSSTSSVPGRRYVNGAPTAGYVLATKTKEVRLSLSGLDASDTTKADGTITVVEGQRLATQWEADGYTGPGQRNAGTDNIIPPACLNTEHNQCVVSSLSSVEYKIDGAASASTRGVTLKTSHPVCQGACPDHLGSGTRFTFTKRQGEDFVSYEGRKCDKRL
jgi:hypothetical protein